MIRYLILGLFVSNFFNLFGQAWQPFSSGVSGTNQFQVNALEVFNGQVVIAGTFTSAGSSAVDNISAWNGSNWSSLGSGIQGAGLVTEINALTVFNNELYAGGTFTSAGTTTVCNIAKWNGNNWVNMATEMSGPFPTIKTMAVYNGSLIVGGIFSSISGVNANYIASWNGTNWSPLGNGVTVANPYSATNPYYNEEIKSLYVFNNELYAGGTFTYIGNGFSQNIAKWNGSSWSSVGSGIYSQGYTSGVLSICSYNSELYTTNGNYGLSKLSGTNWVTIGSGLKFGLNMTVYDNKLITTGFISNNVINVSNIIAYDGSNWSYVGGTASSNGFDNSGHVLKTIGNELYAGGAFVSSNDPNPQTLNGIAKYSGSVNMFEYSIDNQTSIFPNPFQSKLFIPINSEINSKVNVRLISTDGRLLKEEDYDNIANQTIEMDTKNLPSGIYFVELKTDSFKLVKKVIKQI